jgi:thioredoxin:protein disulfide reductase
MLLKTLYILLFDMILLSSPAGSVEDIKGFDFSANIEIISRDENYNFLLLTIAADLATGNYIYADKFSIKIEPDKDLILTKQEFPESEKKFDRFLSKNVSIYSSSALFKLEMKIPAKAPDSFSSQRTIKINYQGCSSSTCYLPRTLEIKKSFSFGEAIKLESYKKLNFLDFLIAKGFLFALLGAFLAGIFASLTPCVYPIIPIVISVIGSQSVADRRIKGFFLSIVFTIGIALVYSSAGIIAARSGLVLGSFLQSPWAILFVSAIFFSMGLSLIGLFEFRLPYFLSKRISGYRGNGYLGTLILGMVTGIVAIPCIGPFAATILALAVQTASIIKGFLLLFSFSIGLGLIFVAVGTFSSLIANIPKPGVWMVTLKKFLGLLIISISVYYIGLLIPLWSVPLIIGLVLFILALIFRKLDSYNDTAVATFNKRMNQICLVLGLIFIILSPLWSQALRKAIQTERMAKDGAITWLSSEKEALIASKSENKPIIIDFYADWCPSCKELEKYTFRDSKVIELSKKFVAFRVDLTEENSQTGGIANKFGVLGLPTIIFLDPKGSEIKDARIEGYLEGSELEKIMEKVLGSANQ